MDCQLSLHGGHVGVPKSRTWACELYGTIMVDRELALQVGQEDPG
jgi:hypothetical protein